MDAFVESQKPLTLVAAKMFSWKHEMFPWKPNLFRSWKMKRIFVEAECVRRSWISSCLHGSWNLLTRRYMSGSTVAVAIASILYFYPSTPPAIFTGRRLAERHSSDENFAGTNQLSPALINDIFVRAGITVTYCRLMWSSTETERQRERERERFV